MSPEQIGSLAAVSRLRGEIVADRRSLRAHEREAGVLAHGWSAAPSPGDIARAAVALHAWYTGLETLLERVARQLDLSVPKSNEWHRELLSQCSVEIAQVRPAVLPSELFGELTPLLSFRHFFRHAYAVELDPVQLATQLNRLLAVAPKVTTALDLFDRFLADVISQLSANP